MDTSEAFGYRALSGSELRLVELLPGAFDDDIYMRISHSPLEEAAKVHAEEPISRAQLQKNLPTGWTAFRTPERKWFFWDGAEPQPTTYEHPDHKLNAKLQASTRSHDGSQLNYEALSYVWGSDQVRHPIYVSTEPCCEFRNGADFKYLHIGTNLRDALKHLRRLDDPRTLWIDAICINQKDLEERSRQVKRMGQIYSLASRVVMWLGPATYDSSVAMSTLQYLGEQIEIGDDSWQFRSSAAKEQTWWDADQKLPYSEKEWESLTSLCTRPWFDRLWVLQEVKLSTPSAVVQCGLDEMSYAVFRRAMVALFDRRGSPLDLQDVIRKRQDTVFVDDRASAAILIKVTRTLQCFDPRDKVYGILSIAGRRFRDAILPSYTLSLGEVYKQAFLSYLDVTSRLDLLVHCSLAPETLQAPSWIPDWRSPPESIIGLDEGFQAAGMSRSATTYTAPYSLQAAGVECDEVSTVFEPLTGNAKEIAAALHSIVPSDILDGTYPTGESMLDAWSRTLFLDSFRDRFPSDVQKVNLVDVTERLAVALSGPPVDALGRLYMKATRRCSNVSFAHTASGLFGFVPTQTRPGDSVCVLLGCWAPMVLRPSSSGSFNVIGSSYIHGLMDGEALLGPLPPGWKTHQQLLNGQYSPRYRNEETEESQIDDPRLEPLRHWTRIDRERDEDDPVNVDYFRHRETGEIANSDPRLLPTELIRRGVDLKTFDLR